MASGNQNVGVTVCIIFCMVQLIIILTLLPKCQASVHISLCFMAAIDGITGTFIYYIHNNIKDDEDKLSQRWTFVTNMLNTFALLWACSLPFSVPSVWSWVGVLVACPDIRSQSMSSSLSLVPTLLQLHSSTSNVQSPDIGAAIWGAAANWSHHVTLFRLNCVAIL